MFLHDQFLRMFWDDTLGRSITGLWGVAWAEWIAIAFLWVLVWRHGHPVLHQRRHPPGVALAAALLPVLGVVANPRRGRAHTWTTARWRICDGDDHEAAVDAVLAMAALHRD